MKTRMHPAFALSLFLLLAVTFWGVRDKVSLYRASGKGLPVAKAKLLSGRELASDAANQVDAVLPPALPPPTCTLVAALVTLLPNRPQRHIGQARLFAPPPSSAPPFAQALFRRPPPAGLPAAA